MNHCGLLRLPIPCRSYTLVVAVSIFLLPLRRCSISDIALTERRKPKIPRNHQIDTQSNDIGVPPSEFDREAGSALAYEGGSTYLGTISNASFSQDIRSPGSTVGGTSEVDPSMVKPSKSSTKPNWEEYHGEHTLGPGDREANCDTGSGKPGLTPSESHRTTEQPPNVDSIDSHGKEAQFTACQTPAAVLNRWEEQNADLTIEGSRTALRGRSGGTADKDFDVDATKFMGRSYTKGRAAPWSPFSVKPRLEGQVEMSSDTTQEAPNIELLEFTSAEHANAPRGLRASSLAVHKTGSQKPMDHSMDVSDRVERPDEEELKVDFDMVIHKRGGQTISRIGTLDSGAMVDLISQEVVTSLGKEMRPYHGDPVSPLGPSNIYPVGEIELEWHILTFRKTYTTNFLVLQDDYCEDFDILLGRRTIGKVKFWKTNNSVWFLDKGDVPSKLLASRRRSGHLWTPRSPA